MQQCINAPYTVCSKSFTLSRKSLNPAVSFKIVCIKNRVLYVHIQAKSPVSAFYKQTPWYLHKTKIILYQKAHDCEHWINFSLQTDLKHGNCLSTMHYSTQTLNQLISSRLTLVYNITGMDLRVEHHFLVMI